MASDTYRASPSWNTNERVLVTEGIYAFERIGTKASERENRPDVADNAEEWTFGVLIYLKINSTPANVYIPTEEFHVTYCLNLSKNCNNVVILKTIKKYRYKYM